VVRISEVEKPTIRDNDVLVRVQATTVNRTDCAYRAGQALLHETHHRAYRATGDQSSREFPG